MGLLRLLLALSVVAVHAHGWWPSWFSGAGGSAAVEAFFVISGFYMALVLNSTYVSRTRDFLFNRFLRIFPEYWLVALLSLLFGLFTNGSFIQVWQQVPAVVGVLLAAANTLIFGSDAVLFIETLSGFHSRVSSATPNWMLHEGLLVAPAWTLALELTFYLAAPVLVRLKSRHLTLIVVTSLATKLLLAGAYLQLPDPWTYRFLGFELSYFLVGILIFRCWHRSSDEWRRWCSDQRLAVVLAAPITVFVLAPGIRYALRVATEQRSIGNLDLYAFSREYLSPFLTVMILAALLAPLFEATKSSALDEKLGRYSYPIYLCHVLAVHVATVLLGALGPNRWSLALASIALIAAVAFLLVKVGQRTDVWRAKIRSRN